MQGRGIKKAKSDSFMDDSEEDKNAQRLFDWRVPFHGPAEGDEIVEEKEEAMGL